MPRRASRLFSPMPWLPVIDWFWLAPVTASVVVYFSISALVMPSPLSATERYHSELSCAWSAQSTSNSMRPGVGSCPTARSARSRRPTASSAFL